MMRLVLSFSGGRDQMAVERAIAEFRTARPVLIEDGETCALAIGIEDLDETRAEHLGAVAGGQARLVLPPARLRRLGVDRTTAGVIALPMIRMARLEALTL